MPVSHGVPREIYTSMLRGSFLSKCTSIMGCRALSSCPVMLSKIQSSQRLRNNFLYEIRGLPHRRALNLLFLYLRDLRPFFGPEGLQVYLSLCFELAAPLPPPSLPLPLLPSPSLSLSLSLSLPLSLPPSHSLPVCGTHAPSHVLEHAHIQPPSQPHIGWLD